MDWTDSPYAAFLLAAAVATVSLALFSWHRRASPGATPLTVLLLGVAVWQVGDAFMLASTDLSDKVFWAKFGYTGIATVPTAWLVVTLQYSGRSRWVMRRNLVLLGVLPLVTLLMAWTNGAHELLWTDVTLGDTGGVRAPEFFYGPWFWVHVVHSYLLLIAGIIFLADALLRSPRLYWGQSVALLVAVLAPWIANWGYAVGLTPVENLDLTPFAFVIAGCALALALIRLRLFDVAPVARKMVFEKIEDGVLVLDARDRIADHNGAARSIIGNLAAEIIGGPVTAVWPWGIESLQPLLDGDPGPSELTLGIDPDRRTYDVSSSPLNDDRGLFAGRLLVFHDITARKRSEDERERLLHDMDLGRQRLRAVSNQLVEVQEAERQHLARELHDEIGQVLTGIQLMMEREARPGANGRTPDLREPLELVSGLLERVREMSLDLRPTMLDDQGLLSTLVWYFKRYSSQTGVKVAFDHSGLEERTSTELETAAFRIVQEGLTNVARHAGVDEATVRIHRDNDTLLVRLEDQGCGFDADAESAGTRSRGLAGMQERATFLGGRLVVKSSPGGGTHITADLPLSRPRDPLALLPLDRGD